MAEQNTFLEAALQYVGSEWPVFPCRKDKRPFTPHGFKDATTDTDQLRRWWAKWPEAMIGIPTGKASGLFVLDIDLPQGEESLIELVAEFGPLPKTKQARSPSGGVHHYFLMPDIARVPSSASKIAPKLDIRADDGYIIVPPSDRGEDKGAYEWVASLPLAAAPDWLVRLSLGESYKKRRRTAGQKREELIFNFSGAASMDIGTSKYARRALEAELFDLRSASEGERNQALNKAAFSMFQLVAGGEAVEDEVRRALIETALQTGLDHTEVERTLESARTAGFAQPRTAPKGVETAEGCIIPLPYKLNDKGERAGLYIAEVGRDGETEDVYLAPPIRVRGNTRNVENGAWGLLLEWSDPEGVKHRWALPKSDLQGTNKEWACHLAAQGWDIAPGKQAKVAAFFQRVLHKSLIRCVPRVGWHGAVFVLPDTTIGDTDGEKVVLQSAFHARMYRTTGTREGWKELAGLAAGNSRLVLALSAAFAGPLLYLAGLESGGFNFMGGSSTGKSTALKLAASVWDGPEYLRSWRTTDNALEGVAALHNDTTLILDELGQAAAKTIGEAAYMLTNGQGKSRAGRDGVARVPVSWRLLFLSSGEVGLAEKLVEMNQRPRAGQSIRLVDVPADAGAEMGIFENLHGYPDPGNLSRQITELASQNYGHAGRAFLHSLVENRLQVQEELRSSLEYFVQQVCPAEADGQVKRVAMRFGICSLAGVLAAHWGIVPWDEKEAVNAAAVCFQAWLSQRGSVGASEDAAILSAVRLFIEQHGASRFQDMDTPAATCINRVGFRRKDDTGETEFIILPESFRAEVVKGFSERRAGQVLAKAGWLQLSQVGRLKVERRLPDLGKAWVYVLRLPEG